MDRSTLTIVTNSSGAGSGKTKNFLGNVAAIVYTKPAADGYSDSVVILAKSVRTGLTIWSETINPNASKTVFPRTKLHDTAGAEILYAAGGANVYGQIPLIQDEVEITITSGGDTKSGTFEVIIA